MFGTACVCVCVVTVAGPGTVFTSGWHSPPHGSVLKTQVQSPVVALTRARAGAQALPAAWGPPLGETALLVLALDTRPPFTSFRTPFLPDRT